MNSSDQNDPGYIGVAADDRPETLEVAEPLVAVVSAARREVADTGLVSRSHAVDWLLDCLNAARAADVGGSARLEIEAGLVLVSQRNASPAEEFHAVLDRVQLASQIDGAFEAVSSV